MCGLAGIVTKEILIEEKTLRNAGNAIRFRGPDHSGIFHDETLKAGFSHQRLSIIDLDSRAHQPMFSENGRFMIVYNGEIYNYKALKQQLQADGVSFSTESDTEVLLKLFIQKGEKCLQQLNGAFAFAVWDILNKELFIARDRLGIKPLYYTLTDDYFAFTSDLKAFQHIPFVKKVLSKEAIWQFLYFGYIPQPDTIFKNVFKLLPGHFMKINMRLDHSIEKYWEIEHKEEASGSYMAEAFRAKLEESVQRRLVSDVEVGAFSSGGIDSASVIALMDRPGSQAFTIGFKHQSNTLDLKRSKEIAAHFNLAQTTTIVGEECLEQFNNYLEQMDEPFSEASILPLLHNFMIAKYHGVKVILSGDGADELLGGYSYFKYIERYRKYDFVPDFFWKGLYATVNLMFSKLPAASKAGKFRDIYLRRTISSMLQSDISRCHQLLVSQKNQNDISRLSGGANGFIKDHLMEELYTDSKLDLNHILANEMKSTLVNKHLAKVDKSSMANSVEARVPFLDHELVELAFTLPNEMKQKKNVLRQAMTGILPQKVIDDRKRGFNLPIKQWTKEYMVKGNSEYISTDKLEEVGVLSKASYQELLKSFLKGRVDHSRTIWSLFVLSGWLRHNEYELE